MPVENLSTTTMPPGPPGEPGEISPLATNQTVFEGRMPDPTEVVRWGGWPGCEYLYAAVDRMDFYMEEHGYGLPKDPVRVTVKGPAGSCRIIVMVKGEPIVGADPLNGIRPWAYDPTIKDKTGLTELFPTEIRLKAKSGPDNPPKGGSNAAEAPGRKGEPRKGS